MLLYSWTKFWMTFFSTLGILLAVVLNTYIVLNTRKNKNFIIYNALSLSMIGLLVLTMLEIVAPHTGWRTLLILGKTLVFIFFSLCWLGFVMQFLWDVFSIRKWFIRSCWIVLGFGLLFSIQWFTPLLIQMDADRYYEPTSLYLSIEWLSLIVFISSVILLVVKHKVTSAIKRRLLYVLVVALIFSFGLTSLLFHYANYMGYAPIMDRLTYTYFIALVLFVFYSKQFKFIDFIPDIMPTILNRLEEGIVVCDTSWQVLETNTAPPMVHFPMIIGNDFKQQLRAFPIENSESIMDFLEHVQLNAHSIKVISADQTLFSMDISPLHTQPVGSVNNHIGYVIVFKDITAYETLIHNVSLKNKELFEINKELMDYSLIVEKLSIEREKNALFLHFQNTLGYSMHVLSDMLEQCKNEQIPLEQLDTQLEQALKFSRDILSEIRSAVKNYSRK